MTIRRTHTTVRAGLHPAAFVLALWGLLSIALSGHLQAQSFRIQIVAAASPAELVDVSRALERHVARAGRDLRHASPLELHLIQTEDWYKLQLGGFRSAAEAAASLREVRSWGFPDAWVTSAPRDSQGPAGHESWASGEALARREVLADTQAPGANPRPDASGQAAVSRAPELPAPELPAPVGPASGPMYGERLAEVAMDSVAPSAVAAPAPDRESRDVPPPALSRARLVATVAGRYESNIDHDADHLSAWGLITGVGIEYAFEGDHTEVDVSYEVARHQYDEAPQWSRIGHVARVGVEQELGGPWNLEVEGEASLGGSTEDRELADVYSLRPRLELELGRDNRLRLKTAFRLKRFEGEPDRNATAPYVGLEFKRYFGAVSWSIESRYELKHTPSERRRYRRWTSETEVALPALFGSRLELGLKYRMKSYLSRLIELQDGTEMFRRDRRIKPSLAWIQPLGGHLEVRLDYEFESRTSNDPGKRYSAHLLGFSLRSQLP